MKILITGGATGLGAATVGKLASGGQHTVYFTYAHSAESAGRLTGTYPNCHSIFCDFTDPASVGGLEGSIGDIGPDVLINNAALPFPKAYLHKQDAAAFSKGFETNVLPVIRITNAAISYFRKQKAGKIINVLSSALIGKPPSGWGEYVAEKNYILSLSRSWATENIRSNITSNCISPSFMKTGFTSDTDERVVEQMIETHPLKQLLTPGEVADAIDFLVHCSRHINGIHLVMNAGIDL